MLNSVSMHGESDFEGGKLAEFGPKVQGLSTTPCLRMPSYEVSSGFA